MFLSDSDSETSFSPSLLKRVENQSGRARGKTQKLTWWNKTIRIYIAIEQSLILNDSLWVILAAPMDIFNKNGQVVAFFYSRAKLGWSKKNKE